MSTLLAALALVVIVAVALDLLVGANGRPSILRLPSFVKWWAAGARRGWRRHTPADGQSGQTER